VAGARRDEAAAAVEDDTFDLPAAAIADGASQCLAAAAFSPSAALAAAVAVRLTAPCAALAAPAASDPAADVTSALSPLAVAGADAGMVASLRPAAVAASPPLWFALLDSPAEAMAGTMGELFGRHGRLLLAAGSGGGACGAAALVPHVATMTAGSGDPRLAAALVPVRALLARAGSGATGDAAADAAAAGAAPLGGVAGAAVLSLARRSLFCPALMGGFPTEAAAGGGAPLAGPEGQWGRDSATTEEVEASGEAEDDAPQSAGAGAAGAEDGDAASPVHALLSGSVEPGDDVSASAGALAATWLGTGPGAGAGGRTACERAAVTVAALAGMTAAAFPAALAALAGPVRAAVDAAAGVAAASFTAAVRAAPTAAPPSLGPAALVARAASGVPAARDASLLLRCACALLDAASWRLANVPGWAPPAELASDLGAMGSRAAEAVSTCVSSRAFARGHAWMDQHCAAIAAVARRHRDRAAAGAPEAGPLLSAARGVLADALSFPPPHG